MSLRDFLQTLKRRKLTALLTFVTVFAGVMALAILSKPQYMAGASLLLKTAPKAGAAAEVSGLSNYFTTQDDLEISTQIELLSSPLILDQVYKDAGVPSDAIDLTVKRREQTNVIDLSAISKSQAAVEKFMATLPKVYLENRDRDRTREVTAQLNFAQQDLEDQSRKLQEAEQELRDFKINNGIVDAAAAASGAVSNVSEVASTLETTRASVSSLQAQIAALQSDLDSLAPSINTPTTITNPQLRELQNQLAELRNARKQLSFSFKDSADEMRQNALAIRAKQAQIDATSPTITNNSRTTNPAVSDATSKIAGLRADLRAQEAQVGVLENQLQTLRADLPKYNKISQQQARLDRAVATLGQAVKTGTDNVRELTVRADALKATAGPVEVLQAGGPAFKIEKKLSRSLILALFLGALLACAMALLQDSLDDRIRDEDEARRLMGAPVLGYFPLLPISDERPILDVAHPDRLMLETFRALRSNVQFALVNSAGKKLQVTSTVPNEGKSYIASNLAITMAMDGRRVILVDADLHRPTIHERFNGARQPGLTNVLVGQCSIEDALQNVGIENLSLLSAGALPPNPAELLNSPAMNEVMKQLEAMADLVIFDTPPLLATSDSQLMSAKMDGVVFVMQMGSVARSGTLRAFELLNQAKANLIGVVFNKVDGGKSAVAYESYGAYYSLAEVPDDEILSAHIADVPVVPVGQLPSGNGDAPNGNGSNGNGSNGNSSNGNSSNGNSFNGGASNGNSSNGGAKNGGAPAPHVGSGNASAQENPGQTTVFDEVLRSGDNSN